MKMGNQMRLFAGGWVNNSQAQGTANQNQNRRTMGAVFARHQNTQDKVAQKKLDAREKAMKIVSSAFQADKTIDDDLASRASKIENSKSEILAAQAEIRALNAKQKEYMEQYGVEADSQEQQDLELLRKRRDSMKPDSDIVLTEEEQERLAQIDEEGMTEYQKISLENDSYKAPFQKTIEENRKVVLEEQQIMTKISLERLKSDPMVGAAKQAEDEMAAANKEIISMVLGDAKDKVDEDMQEIKEDRKESKEEKEEEEARIEEIQQRNEELEAAAQNRRAENKHKSEMLDISTDQIIELDAVKSDVQQELDNMLFDMKILAEDLKGSVVDAKL